MLLLLVIVVALLLWWMLLEIPPREREPIFNEAFLVELMYAAAALKVIVLLLGR